MFKKTPNVVDGTWYVMYMDWQCVSLQRLHRYCLQETQAHMYPKRIQD
jgi:hypothetical protein